jgi:hypothetical protein
MCKSPQSPLFMRHYGDFEDDSEAEDEDELIEEDLIDPNEEDEDQDDC